MTQMSKPNVLFQFKMIVLLNRSAKLTIKGWLALKIQHSRYSSQSTYQNILSRENEFAREIMQEHGKYILWPMACDSNTPSSRIMGKHAAIADSKIISTFRQMADLSSSNSNISFNSAAFTGIYHQLIESCASFSNTQLFEVLGIFARININSMDLMADHIVMLRNTLNELCASRCKQWSLDQLLLACDIWYQIPFAQQLHFIQVACDLFAARAKHATPQQLVQALFYLNWRKLPVERMHAFEQKLSIHFDELSIDELAISAMGFFKTNTNIECKILIKRFYELLLDNDLKLIPELSLTTILKVILINWKPGKKTRK